MSLDRANHLVSSVHSVLFMVAQVKVLVLIITAMTGAKLAA